MPGTNTGFGQMYDHELNPRYGWVGDRGSALEKVLPISATNNNTVQGGAVVHIDDNNEFKLGIDATGLNAQTRVPLFSFPNGDDFDVNPDLGNIAGGVLMALCALGDFELESTEFEADVSGGYAPGKYLTADDGSGNPNTAAGEITLGNIGTHVIVGIISESGTNSDGSFENEHGQNVIRFWSWFMPDTFTSSGS